MKKKWLIGLLGVACTLTMVGATACGGGGDPGDPGNGPGSEQTQKYDVTLTKNIAGAGAVLGGGEYDENSSVTVTATTNSGYTFLGWYKGSTCVSTQSTYTFTLTEDILLQAKWEETAVDPAQKYTISITKNIQEAGTVEGAGEYDANTQVTLKATTNAGYTFLGWYVEGQLMPFPAETQITVTQNISVEARWEVTQTVEPEDPTNPVQKYTITITKNIEEAGEVTGAGEYDENTQVTIKATTNAGYTFLGWYYEGQLLPIPAETQITVTQNLSVEARWEVTQTTEPEGPGGGTVDPEEPEHTCVFDKQVAEDAYKASDATCQEKATYYYSCACGEKGTTTFESGEFAHTFEKQVTTDDYKASDATCEAKATYYYSCECGEKGTETFDNGDFAAHNLVDGECTVCHAKESEGLSYALSDDETYYIVTGIGTCTDTEVIIPAEYEGLPVQEIAWGAFQDRSTLTSIIMPDSVARIGAQAFYNCVNLMGVVLGSGVTSIQNAVFGQCSKLEKVNYAGAIDDWAQIDFGGSVLSSNRNLYINDILVTEANITTATKISNYAFCNCTSLTSVTIGDSVESIGYGAFSGCTSLTSITIGDSVTSIGDYTFDGCAGLVGVTIGDGVTSIGCSAFRDCVDLMSVNLPNGVTSIDSLTFYNCSSLTSIEIPDGVTSILGLAFYNCNSLTGIEIPDSVTSIGNSAFEYCDALTSLVVGSNVGSIGQYAFRYCYKLVEVINKSSKINLTKGTQNNGFVGYYALVVYNSDDTFTGTKLSNDNGYIIYTDGEEKILVAYQGEETELTLPDYITKINQYAFEHCSNLTSITIPNGVTSIGLNAFEYCYRLVEVVNKSPDITVTKGSSDNGRVGYYAWEVFNISDEYVDSFINDNGYIIYTDGEEKILVAYQGEEKDLIIPSYVTKINKFAFYGCNTIESITLPFVGESPTASGFKAVVGYIFGYTTSSSSSVSGATYQYQSSGTSTYYHYYIPTSLKSVTIMGGDIPDYAFKGCNMLTSITLPGDAERIGSNAFSDCVRLTHITIPDTVTSIGVGAFENCEGLSKVNYTGTIDDWAQIIFEGEGILTSTNPTSYAKDLYINDVLVTEANITTATKISAKAFSYCSSLTSVTIGDSVTSIGNDAFYDCESLTSITIPDSVESIGDYAFSFCDSLTSVTIGDSVESIGDGAFSACRSLTNVVVPNSVTSIGHSAFYGCHGLISATIEGATTIGKSAFEYCDSLTNVTFGADFVGVGSDAFSYCKELGKINYKGTIEGWVQKEFNDGWISTNYSFYIDDVEITQIEIATVEIISSNAFLSCSSLTSVTIGKGVQIVGFEAFAGCINLNNVSVNATRIGESAFAGCNSLATASIGGNVSNIGRWSFSACTSLDSIFFMNATTWYRTKNHSDWLNKKSGTKTSVSVNSTNATYFKSTYSDYYWYRK